MTSIKGRTAFITGGANGIGFGIAQAFAGAGAKIALADIDEKALEHAREKLNKVTDVKTVVLDVRDREGYARIADEVEADLGPVSLLFNNAGVGGGAPAGKMTYKLWDWGMGINLDGVINGVQTFLPRMIERADGGHIVNTASGAGLAVAGTGAGVLYHTAKYGVVGMAEALAAELVDENIGVTVLCPGPVATGIIERTSECQPNVMPSLSQDQKNAVNARNVRMKNWLEHGTSPEDVGQWVLKAVETGQFYVHTDRFIVRYVEARTKAILEAVPEE